MHPDSEPMKLAIALIITLAVVLLITLYVPSLNLGLLSDDFWILSFQNPWSFSNMRYRYCPLGVTLLQSVYTYSRLSPISYHLISITLHAINTILVGFFAFRLTKRQIVGALSALLFLIYCYNYEAVFWIAASCFYLPMTLLFLAGCLIAVASSDEAGPQRRKYLFYFPIIFTALLLFQEQGIAFLIAVVLLDCYTSKIQIKRERLASLASRIKLYEPMILIALAFFLIRLLFLQKLFVVYSSLSKRMFNFVVVHCYLLLPFGRSIYPLRHTLGRDGPIFIALLLIVISIWLFKSRFRRYGLLLLIMQSTFIPFVCLSSIQPRYLYLPSAIGSIIVALFIYDIGKHIPAWLISIVRRDKRSSLAQIIRTVFIIVLCALVAGWLLLNSLFLIDRLQDWKKATTIAHNIIDDSMKKMSKQSRPINDVALVNFPDSISEDDWPAYIFRMGARQALMLAFQEHPLLPKNMKCPRIKEMRIGKDEFFKLAPFTTRDDTLVLIYDEDNEKISIFKGQTTHEMP